MHGLDVVLVARDACALRGMVDDIDEVGIIGLFDGGCTPPSPLSEGEG